ncbi:MAG: hypothetical protein IKA47_08965, partial [Oscillospiraceae bacterium]|nr:hypothetical protein [Oscillospiraceae bacterium]
SSGRGFAPPSERTNRPCKDRHLSKLLQLAIAICHIFLKPISAIIIAKLGNHIQSKSVDKN